MSGEMRPLTESELADDVRPPTDAEVAGGLAEFSRRVRELYADRLKGVLLFGSRARGDHRPESDADVVVVLSDGDWREYDELMKLSDISFDVLLDHRTNVHPWPLPESAWLEPERYSNPWLVRAMRQDGQDA